MTKAYLLRALSAVTLFYSTGCDDVDWPEPRYVDSLRVLGVQAEPPTLTPGASTELSLRCVDGRRGTQADPTCLIEVAWFSRCDNPLDNDPENCVGNYSDWTDQLDSRIANTPVEAYPDGFGFGLTYNVKAPGNILRKEFTSTGSVVKYGVSYVFFAACAGQLTVARSPSHQLPVECHDRKTGRKLDHRNFIVGVTTLYSYDALKNRNPLLSAPRFDNAAIPDSCTMTADCPAGFECSTADQCVPVVQHCAEKDAEDCEEHCLSFELGLDSFHLFSVDGSRLETPTKSLWLSYLTNAGNLPADEANFALEAPTFPALSNRTPCIRWQPPTTPTEQAHLWAVVRDNRGGLSTWDQRIIVR